MTHRVTLKNTNNPLEGVGNGKCSEKCLWTHTKQTYLDCLVVVSGWISNTDNRDNSLVFLVRRAIWPANDKPWLVHFSNGFDTIPHLRVCCFCQLCSHIPNDPRGFKLAQSSLVLSSRGNGCFQHRYDSTDDHIGKRKTLIWSTPFASRYTAYLLHFAHSALQSGSEPAGLLFRKAPFDSERRRVGGNLQASLFAYETTHLKLLCYATIWTSVTH